MNTSLKVFTDLYFPAFCLPLQLVLFNYAMKKREPSWILSETPQQDGGGSQHTGWVCNTHNGWVCNLATVNSIYKKSRNRKKMLFFGIRAIFFSLFLYIKIYFFFTNFCAEKCWAELWWIFIQYLYRKLLDFSYKQHPLGVKKCISPIFSVYHPWYCWL